MGRSPAAGREKGGLKREQDKRYRHYFRPAVPCDRPDGRKRHGRYSGHPDQRESSKELIRRICDRMGYKVLDIGKAERKTFEIDLAEMWWR